MRSSPSNRVARSDSASRPRRRWLSALPGGALWGALLASFVALAPTHSLAGAGAGEDEVILKNGGMVRGTVVSMEPGKNVVLMLPSGEERTIEWDEVEKVERGKHKEKDEPEEEEPAEAEEPTPVESAPAEAGPAPGPGVVRLHIEGDEPGVQLYRVLGTAMAVGPGGTAFAQAQEIVCTAPCDQIIDGSKGEPYFFAGDGITASDPFTLTEHQGDIMARVETGSAGARTGGLFMAYTGAPLAAGGIVLTIMGFAMDDETGAMDTFKIMGPIMGGVGVALLIPGIVLAAGNSTDYQFVTPETAKLPGSDVEVPTGRWLF